MVSLSMCGGYENVQLLENFVANVFCLASWDFYLCWFTSFLLAAEICREGIKFLGYIYS